MDTSNRSKKEPSESRKMYLQKCVEILTRWFTKWSACFPNHPVSKLQIATYAEALVDLTLDQLEHGCKCASQEMEQFPKPGHIRKCAEEMAREFEEYLGPPQIKYPEIDEAERLEALNDPQYLELKAKIKALAKKKSFRYVVESSDERKKKLMEQTKYILEKYGPS